MSYSVPSQWSEVRTEKAPLECEAGDLYQWTGVTLRSCQGFPTAKFSTAEFYKVILYGVFVPSSGHRTLCHRVICITSASVPGPCPVAVVKYPDKSKRGGNRLIPAHTSGLQSIPAGNSKHPDTSQSRAERIGLHVCRLFPLLHRSGPNPWGNGATLRGRILPHP